MCVSDFLICPNAPNSLLKGYFPRLVVSFPFTYRAEELLNQSRLTPILPSIKSDGNPVSRGKSFEENLRTRYPSGLFDKVYCSGINAIYVVRSDVLYM